LFCDDIEMPFRVLPPLVELITKDCGGDDECAADEVAAFQTNRPLKLLLRPNPQALQTQSFSTRPSRQYVDTTGAIAGWWQLGHRGQFDEKHANGVGAWI
jgi:hypothetical protein